MADEEYWRRCALWMADVIAATADHMICLKGTPRSEKQRHARIAEMAADAIVGRNCPSARPVDVIEKRLRAIPDAESL